MTGQNQTREPWVMNRNISIVTLGALTLHIFITVSVIAMWKGRMDAQVGEIDTRTETYSDRRMSALEIRANQLEARPRTVPGAAVAMAVNEANIKKLTETMTQLAAEVTRVTTTLTRYILSRSDFDKPDKLWQE